ncbi:MAG: NAD(P)H-binding protein [Methanococcaceae archaeon]
MKKVIIIGAGGNIARKVTDMLLNKTEIDLSLFLRNSSYLKVTENSRCHIVQGDVMNYEVLKNAVSGKDIVYVNLAGNLEAMAKNIVSAMKETGVKRVIFISSIGIYDTPVKSVLQPYRKATDVFERSGLEYTILRPSWFTSADEVHYEITKKGEHEKGSGISQKSLASFIVKIIETPDEYINANLGINKPWS